jgi:hypothetical protein
MSVKIKVVNGVLVGTIIGEAGALGFTSTLLTVIDRILGGNTRKVILPGKPPGEDGQVVVLPAIYGRVPTAEYETTLAPFAAAQTVVLLAVFDR